MTSPLSIEQEADALEALVGPMPQGIPPGRVREFYQRAPALIRALRERVAFLTECNKHERAEWQALCECQEKLMHAQARIESLEAERDIWRERATKGSSQGAKPPNVWSFVDTTPPTPEEIAARVAERKARTP